MMSMPDSGPLTVLLAAVLVLAVWFDVRENRIPNWLTAGGFVCALVIRATLGLDHLGTGIAGAGVGLALGVALFAIGAMGAGDGKLLAAVGAFFGLDLFLKSLPLVGAFGGLLALAVTLSKGTLIATLLRFRELLFYVVSFGRIGSRRTLEMPGAVTVPYGVAVAAGAAVAWLGWGGTL